LDIGRDDINVEGETVLATSDTRKTGTSTFNVSTATAFVLAGLGLSNKKGRVTKPAPQPKKNRETFGSGPRFNCNQTLSLNHYSGGRTSLLQLRQHQFLSVKIQFVWMIKTISLYEIQKSKSQVVNPKPSNSLFGCFA
jgi:hypothetical protein